MGEFEEAVSLYSQAGSYNNAIRLGGRSLLSLLLLSVLLLLPFCVGLFFFLFCGGGGVLVFCELDPLAIMTVQVSRPVLLSACFQQAVTRPPLTFVCSRLILHALCLAVSSQPRSTG